MKNAEKLQDSCDFGFFYVTIKKTVQLSPSGSNRLYFRLFDSDNHSYIGVKGTSVEENQAFIYLSNYFFTQGINVPRVLAVSDDKLSYIQEDLGDVILFDFLSDCRKNGYYDEQSKLILHKTIEHLAYMQTHSSALDYSVCYPQAEFNERSVLWDLNYFKYCFLKPSGLDFQENLLENDFQLMARFLTNVKEKGFLYRDFQSRNIMIHDDKPYFIDFQGGRFGPIHYDVASFLWQAKANFPNELKEELIKAYLLEINKFIEVDESCFRSTLQHFILFRTLQVLGAYGYRGWFERKAHFLQSIPYAISNLKDLLKNDFSQYPYLTYILEKLTQLPQLQMQQHSEKLVVTVYSFSYKQGVPTDNSGNGGGFVFDCRAIHNPGKYDKYKTLTGLDKPVQEFLENDGEILYFLSNVYNIVDKSVERYLSRGFTSLMISFGCTGGQHRSAYSAQKTAEHIKQKYNVAVRLIHRELGISSFIEN